MRLCDKPIETMATLMITAATVSASKEAERNAALKQNAKENDLERIRTNNLGKHKAKLLHKNKYRPP